MFVLADPRTGELPRQVENPKKDIFQFLYKQIKSLIKINSKKVIFTVVDQKCTVIKSMNKKKKKNVNSVTIQ